MIQHHQHLHGEVHPFRCGVRNKSFTILYDLKKIINCYTVKTINMAVICAVCHSIS